MERFFHRQVTRIADDKMLPVIYGVGVYLLDGHKLPSTGTGVVAVDDGLDIEVGTVAVIAHCKPTVLIFWKPDSANATPWSEQ